MKRSRQRQIARTLVFLMTGILFFFGGSVWLINRPATLRYLLSFLNSKSPWNIEATHMVWTPWRNHLSVKEIALSHPHKGQQLRIEKIDLSYRFLPLLRGKLSIDESVIQGVTLELPPQEKKEKKKTKLELKKLFLLQNIALNNTRILNIDIHFGKKSRFTTQEMRIAFDRTFLGKNWLRIGFDELHLFSAEHEILTSERLTLKAETELERWEPTFPYVNDLTGEVEGLNLLLEGTDIQKTSAQLKYSDQILTLSSLSLEISENILSGSCKANFTDETFGGELTIPKAVHIPHLVKPLEVMDTEGLLSGKISFEGRGFSPLQSTGKAVVDITHRFSRAADRENRVTTSVSWEKGLVSFREGLIRAGESETSFHGSLDISHQQIVFEGNGKKFPLEYFFEQFRDPHLKLLFGTADFAGTFQGWGKKFQAHVEGKVHDGGWKPIAAEELHVLFEASYDKLSVQGTIVQNGKQTGDAIFALLYGPKKENQPRPKKISLQAHIENYDLGASLGTPFALTGEATGDIELSGPVTQFSGKAAVKATAGTWYKIPYDVISNTFTLTNKQIVFSNMALKAARLQERQFSAQLVLDFQKESFRLHGTPIPELTLDLSRENASGIWTFRQVSYASLLQKDEKVSAHGTIQKDGTLNLSLTGLVNLTLLHPISHLVREAEGKATVDLKLRGLASDPLLFGNIQFHQALFSPRFTRLRMENITGSLHFEGKSIQMKDIHATVEDGHFSLKGNAMHHNATLESANLSFSCESLTFRPQGLDLRLTLDADVTLQGRFPSPFLKGNVTVIDGRYSKNFRLIDSIQGREEDESAEEETMSTLNPTLALRVRNSGEFLIRNNIGDIDLRFDLAVTGTRKKPTVNGVVDVAGTIHYLGLKFDITRGFLEFREPYATPYLEVTAEREIGASNVTLFLRGETENLSLDLSGTSPEGPLNKKDVLSLIAFGFTEEDRRSQRNDISQERLASKVLSSQVSSVLQRPISEFTSLDVFRLEAADPASSTGSRAISRVYIGKQVNDRLKMDFSTDINSENATQTVKAEYSIIDNILLTGSRSSNNEFGARITLRFRSR